MTLSLFCLYCVLACIIWRGSMSVLSCSCRDLLRRLDGLLRSLCCETAWLTCCRDQDGFPPSMKKGVWLGVYDKSIKHRYLCKLFIKWMKSSPSMKTFGDNWSSYTRCFMSRCVWSHSVQMHAGRVTVMILVLCCWPECDSVFLSCLS